MIDEMKEVKNELRELKNESFAMELLRDSKKQNKRLFTIWVITFISFCLMVGYCIYLLNDIQIVETVVTETETYTQEVEEIGEINGSIVNSGGGN